MLALVLVSWLWYGVALQAQNALDTACARTACLNPHVRNSIIENGIENPCSNISITTYKGKDSTKQIWDNVSPPPLASAGFPACDQFLNGKCATIKDEGIQKTTITYKAVPTLACPTKKCPIAPELTEDSGAFGKCVTCSTCKTFTITPKNDNDPLNGVSTYDLILINRHILGSEPINNPYTQIAADANMSNTITTFDVTEIRKVILGINTQFPNVESWRFFDKTKVFTDPTDPFQDLIPLSVGEWEKVTTDGSTPSDFVGVKIGDINLSAMANNRPAERPVATLDFQGFNSKKAGSFITVPVRYTGSSKMTAYQMGLQFDPSKLRLISPSEGDIPGFTLANFGLTAVSQGHIRTLWLNGLSDADYVIQEGDVLFYLSFEVLQAAGADDALALSFDDNVLYNAAWSNDDTEYAMVQQTAADRTTTAAVRQPDIVCSPNPTGSSASLTITPKLSERVRIGLFDVSGRNISLQNIELTAGQTQQIQFSELGKEPAGVYVWKVYNKSFKAQGHLIKM